MADYIMTMHKIGKFIPPDRDLIKDITLSFMHGAKIGVLGPNGAGKSTLLKIMAGIDTDFLGELRLTPGNTVGMLMQEPQLDDDQERLRQHPRWHRRCRRAAQAVRRGTRWLG